MKYEEAFVIAEAFLKEWIVKKPDVGGLIENKRMFLRVYDASGTLLHDLLNSSCDEILRVWKSKKTEVRTWKKETRN